MQVIDIHNLTGSNISIGNKIFFEKLDVSVSIFYDLEQDNAATEKFLLPMYFRMGQPSVKLNGFPFPGISPGVYYIVNEQVARALGMRDDLIIPIKDPYGDEIKGFASVHPKRRESKLDFDDFDNKR